jgi:parallel beta-helix repeat protein
MKSSLRIGFLTILFVLASQSSVFAMSQPTLPHCEGSNLTECSSIVLIVFDNTPEFSAIVNYSTYGSPSQENAWIQVTNDNNSWVYPNLVWDSGNKGITFTYNGNRCQDILYGTLGNGGSLNGNLQIDTTYYWRISFYGNSSSPQWSGWKHGRFKTGHEFNHHYVFFKPSNSVDSPEGSFPYSSEENWCKGTGNLAEIVTRIIGDNNSNPGGTGTSSWNLTSKQVNVTLVLDCGTGYNVYIGYYKLNEYNQQVFLDGRFVTSFSSYIAIDCSSDSKPVIQPGTSTDAVVINAPWTRVRNITAKGSSYSGYSGFKATSENSNYITFDNCTAYYNFYGFIVGTGSVSTVVQYDNIHNCTAHDNDYYGIYVQGRANYIDIYNCKAFDNSLDGAQTQDYGIKIEAQMSTYDPKEVFSVSIRNNEVYNNLYYGIYVTGSSGFGAVYARKCSITEFNRIYNNGVYGIYDAGLTGDSSDNALLIKNNIIWAGDNQDSGIRIASGYVYVVNNVLYDHANAAVYQYGTGTYHSKVRNNIISIKDSSNSYGIYCNSASPFDACDYNDFFKMGNGNGKVGFFNSSAYSALSDWQTATPYDDDSLSIDPKFVNTSTKDFHLKSEAGHWDEATSQWVTDAETSGCIDKGDPADDYSLEPAPNGNRINQGGYGGTIYASKSSDGTAPVVSGAHIQSGSSHTSGDGLSVTGGIVAGCSSLYVDYNSITENNPDCTSFTLTVTGGAGSSTTTDGTDTTTPNPAQFTGLALNGGTKLVCQVGHKDKAGNYGENTSETYFVKPFTPIAPTVAAVTGNTSALTVDVNPYGSESSAVEYSFFCTTTDSYVQSIGTLGATEIFQTDSAWGTKTVTGLTEGTTYSFQVRSRNYYEHTVYSDNSSSSSATVNISFTAQIDVIHYIDNSSSGFISIDVFFNESKISWQAVRLWVNGDVFNNNYSEHVESGKVHFNIPVSELTNSSLGSELSIYSFAEGAVGQSNTINPTFIDVDFTIPRVLCMLENISEGFDSIVSLQGIPQGKAVHFKSLTPTFVQFLCNGGT